MVGFVRWRRVVVVALALVLAVGLVVVDEVGRGRGAAAQSVSAEYFAVSSDATWSPPSPGLG